MKNVDTLIPMLNAEHENIIRTIDDINKAKALVEYYRQRVERLKSALICLGHDPAPKQ